MIPLADIFALLVALLIGAALQRYFILTSGERKTNVPFIKGFNFFLGSNDILFANNKILAINAHDRFEEFQCDTFGGFFGDNMQLFTRDVDLIYKLCVTEFQRNKNRYYVNSLSRYMKASLLEARDSEWQTSRRAIASVLKASKLKVDNVEIEIDKTIGELLDSLDKQIEKSQRIGKEPIFDVLQMSKNFFLQGVLKILFDTGDLIDFENEHNAIVDDLHGFIHVNYEFVARVCFLIPTLTDFVRPILGLFDHGKFLAVLKAKLDKILMKTFKSQSNGSNKQEVENSATAAKRLTTIHSLINSYRRGKLTREQLMGNAIFLMVAGFATSIDIMTVFMWELAKNHRVQEKLRADLRQYGSESKYLAQCLDEALRMYPGAFTNREIGEHIYHKDFRVVKGSCLNICIYSVQRDTRLWGPDANSWNPERFDPRNVLKHHPAQFIPFGIGPRNCVGYHLAKVELLKLTAQFLLRYKLELCSETRSEMEYATLGPLPFALAFQGPVKLKITPVISTKY